MSGLMTDRATDAGATDVGATDVGQIARLDDEELWRLARTEYDRMLAVLRSLGPGDLGKPTDCAAWTVRDMVGHLVGAAEGFSRPPELLSQYARGLLWIRRGKTDGRQLVDGANAVQVADRARLPYPELLSRYEQVIGPILRWRRRLRLVPAAMNDVGGRFTFRELFEVVLTRDTWMHRVDISRAVGADLVVTPEHDGRIVADAVRDWAGRHGRPFLLRLGGPAGGDYRSGEGGEELELDAVEFMRVLSGRVSADGVLATRVVF
jgi:uncharacterized protein (TIGR03083 family)